MGRLEGVSGYLYVKQPGAERQNFCFPFTILNFLVAVPMSRSTLSVPNLSMVLMDDSSRPEHACNTCH